MQNCCYLCVTKPNASIFTADKPAPFTHTGFTLKRENTIEVISLQSQSLQKKMMGQNIAENLVLIDSCWNYILKS